MEETAEDARTLRIQLSDEHIDGFDQDEKFTFPPPLPDAPPPSLNEKEKGAMIGATTTATASNSTADVTTSSALAGHKGVATSNSVKQHELLKFIMDNHLETS